MKSRLIALAIASAVCAVSSSPQVRVTLRSRVEAFKGSGAWEPVAVTQDIDPSRTALVICDVWDRHWCSGAEARVAILAPRIEKLVEQARKRGILVIHAPSETMKYYTNRPERIKMAKIAAVNPPADLPLNDPPLPIDDSDGGCDSATNKIPKDTAIWTRENPAISIDNRDLISDNGREIFSALHARGVETLLFAGVHANMCILNRTFGIRQMTRWGVHCILIRDLTDTMYNPARAPHVSHVAGTELVIEHIERYWAPTVTSTELTRALSGN